MAMSRTHLTIVILVFVAIIALFTMMEVSLPSVSHISNDSSVVFTRINKDEGTLTIVGSRTPNTMYRVKIADTEEERSQGLSGVLSLKDDEGMLFLFPEEGYHTFWMKDMHFPLDLVWIDSSWNIVSTTKNATPESYPTLFSPPRPVQYVLEIPS